MFLTTEVIYLSKYTTEVRYICEQLAGFKESQDASKIDDIISLSWDKIFTTKCSFFDESYRKIICSKILKHYYLREIGCETVGMWVYWMNTKLEEIMPYYNQLYKSAELEFSPFDNMNYTKTGTRNTDGTKNSSGENKNNTTTNNTDKITNTSKDKSTMSKTGTDETNSDSSTSFTGNQTSDISSTDYNLYSDTPQGSLTGVENQTYLTDARKITNTGKDTTNNNSTTTTDDTSTSNTSEDTTSNRDTTETIDKTSSGTNNVTGSTKNEEINAISENYSESINGKTSSTSYSKLLNEYRESMINIDMMVIEEFSELFLLLW